MPVFVSPSIGLLSGITSEKYALTVIYISNFLKVPTALCHKFLRACSTKEIVTLKHVNNICYGFSHEWQCACLVEHPKVASHGNTDAWQSLCCCLSLTTWYLATVMIHLNYRKVSCAETLERNGVLGLCFKLVSFPYYLDISLFFGGFFISSLTA